MTGSVIRSPLLENRRINAFLSIFTPFQASSPLTKRD